MAWSVLSFAMVGLVAGLDGGYASPIAHLVLLPMLFLAVGYPRPAVLVCGGFGISISALVAITTEGHAGIAAQTMGMLSMLLGFVLAMIGATFRDRQRAELQAMSERLEYLAATDELTQCLSRRAFNACLSAQIADAEHKRLPLSLLVIDVDRFKRINDERGHLVGDDVLLAVANVIRASARHSDMSGRPGGDEFALIAPNTNAAEALGMAKRIHAALAATSLPVAITLSVGIFSTVPTRTPATTFFQRADQALYEAKRRGRNCSVAWKAQTETPHNLRTSA